jgi:tetratricopeptide (TPR) repeat protein
MRLDHLLAAVLVSLPVAVVGGCGGRQSSATLVAPTPSHTPAQDLAAARGEATREDPSAGGLESRDPRVIDLDIIRIQATPDGVGGEPELTSVASADLFREGNDAAKAGRGRDAIASYRRLLTDFPDSQYAPLALFNIAAVYDGQGDVTSTITTLRELVAAYPESRESIDGHLYIAALQSDRKQWSEAVTTLDEVLARKNLTFADRVEAYARKGYAQLEQGQLDAADLALDAAISEWRKATRIDDPYYIAMAHFYRGEVMHQRFANVPVRTGDDEMVADLEHKRVLAGKAYDRWKEALGFKHAYWATAAGYQMSQIFFELWEAHVTAPYPQRVEVSARPTYVVEVHDRVREHLEKALEGHRMNVELAEAFGVQTSWSRGSEQQAVRLMELLAREARGDYIKPSS